MSGKPHFVGTVSNKGQDISVDGIFLNNFKRPCSLTVTVEQKSSRDEAHATVITGDRFQVWHTMAALGEIAWNMGWRPPGLSATLGGVVSNYQIPSSTKVGREVTMSEQDLPAPTKKAKTK